MAVFSAVVSLTTLVLWAAHLCFEDEAECCHRLAEPWFITEEAAPYVSHRFRCIKAQLTSHLHEGTQQHTQAAA